MISKAVLVVLLIYADEPQYDAFYLPTVMPMETCKTIHAPEQRAAIMAQGIARGRKVKSAEVFCQPWKDSDLTDLMESSLDATRTGTALGLD